MINKLSLMYEDRIALVEETIKKHINKVKAPELCKGCAIFEKFKKECWFYWDDKSFCSQYTSNGLV
jgi:hypothetical protein